MVLRITLLADEFKKSTKGGLSTLNRQLAIQLAKVRSVKVYMLMPKATAEDRRDAKKHKIEIFETLECVGLEPAYWLGYPPEDFVTDIIIGHDVKLGWPGYVIRRSCSAKWIHVVHTNAEELGLYKNYKGAISRGQEKQKSQMKLCEMADLVVTVGPKLRKSVSPGTCPQDKVFNLIPGPFEEFSTECKELDEKEQFEILLFGRGDPEDIEVKGFKAALDIFNKLKQEDKTYSMTIVGAPEGSQDDLMEKLTSSSDGHKPYLREYVEDREELKKLFMDFDLVLMPSKTDGFGLAALEALSAGVAILVSSNCGLAEVLQKIPLGSQCVVDSEDDWVKAIKKVRQKNVATRNEEARLLRDKYNEMYPWTSQCVELVKLMKKMCQGAPKESSKTPVKRKAPATLTNSNGKEGAPKKSRETLVKRKAPATLKNSNGKEGTTLKTASKKRKSGGKGKTGNELGGATPKTTSKKRKSGDKSKPSNESGGDYKKVLKEEVSETTITA